MNLPNIDLALLQTPSLDQIQAKILLTDYYTEHKESAEQLSKRVNQKAL